MGYLLLCSPLIMLMLAQDAEERCDIANNFNFDVYNSFLIRTTTYFPLEMYLKERVINCILQRKAIYRQNPQNPSMLFSKKLLKQVHTKKLSLFVHKSL